MKSNLTFVETENGGIEPHLIINDSVFKKVEPFLAWDMREFYEDHRRCVIPSYDHEQRMPITRRTVTVGYETLFHAFMAVLTGYHFWREWPLVYRANSEGLRLIAEHGSPHKAFAALVR